jgi:hypothetical protein
MKKRKKDPIREDRIDNQAFVDAYGPQERAMRWYYYLEKPTAVSTSGQMHHCKYRFAAQQR